MCESALSKIHVSCDFTKVRVFFAPKIRYDSRSTLVLLLLLERRSTISSCWNDDYKDNEVNNNIDKNKS